MHRGVPLTGSIIFAAGVVLGLAAFGSDTSLPGRNDIPSASPAFETGTRTHETHAESQTALEFPNVGEIPAQTETGLPQGPAPTRSGFMASWDSASGAIGYRLDVSMSSSFSSYVNGYRDLDVGNVTGRVVTGLSPGTTYYIHATFDSSITTNPNAAAIEAMINRAISIYESLFSDPITIQILFRYSATAPDGTPLPSGTTSQSDFVVYTISWSAYINALRADVRTSNDILANASLPGTALSPNMKPSSAGGRAVGLNTPPAMSANGSLGGPYDGIVTLNSSDPFQFTRPPSASNYDAQRSTEHEIDEVIGFGSDARLSNLRPQDLFSWSSTGHRNVSSTGARYFSINSGSTNIVNFNQNSNGDFGDWLSPACPQAHPYVQNAFVCAGQSSDVTATSPEGVNLDVIGYDLAGAPRTAARAAVFDFNGDGSPDYVLRRASTRQTAIWYLDNNVFVGSAYGPTLLAGWGLASVADFNRDGHTDYALFNPISDRTGIWYLSGPTFIGSAYGPTLPTGWELVAAADFSGDGRPDYVLYKASTRQTAIWYLNNNVYVIGGFGPTPPAGWSLMGVADFNRDGHTDYALFNSSTGRTAIWYLSGRTLVAGAFGPTIPSGWELAATADFNGDGKPDYVLYNANTRRTAIWYLNNNVYAGSAYGPTVPAGWSLVAP